ncbi:spermine/spermidine synthase [Gonapodya prolifera JEL478]|uniref:Spermine/spermidine synthase n=1 Tax=Gonapodya prolifera (strain JEL478) TaxID=1344416 RepID=A0A139AWJ9_GONPJ|nr:spermine/spermidine synthase [Gonapodya prolifera JEL478]|eukprot:KXS20845.1 spermine/spermidine synthase [Gonapodya prolifera JEL478]
MAPITHPNIGADGWFRETPTMWPGQCMSLQVKEVLHHEKSLFQDVLVFKSTNHGTVLVLDGVIQATENDEFAYQEMIAHLPLMSHPNPKNVLVVGGGDGGVLREVVRHPSVESVTLCEIDEAVCRVSKLYLPEMAAGFEHPKVTVHIGDGFEFLKDKKELYDVIITDSSDPVGPAEVLFQDTFYKLIFEALKPDGVFCNQGECQWLHLPLIRQVLDASRLLYPTVEYAWASVPTYPSGQIGFLISSKNKRELRKPLRKFDEETQKALRYYTAEVHEAAFVLPAFAKRVVEGPKA